MKRFEITLLIRHPHLDPGEITAEMGLQPYQSWKAGDPRITPKGTRLPGVHADSCWNYVYRFSGQSRFSEKIDEILNQLYLHRTFFQKLHKSGSASYLYLKLPGDTNIGDDVSWETLKKFADLKIAFSLEVFPDMP